MEINRLTGASLEFGKTLLSTSYNFLNFYSNDSI